MIREIHRLTEEADARIGRGMGSETGRQKNVQLASGQLCHESKR